MVSEADQGWLGVLFVNLCSCVVLDLLGMLFDIFFTLLLLLGKFYIVHTILFVLWLELYIDLFELRIALLFLHGRLDQFLDQGSSGAE